MPGEPARGDQLSAFWELSVNLLALARFDGFYDRVSPSFSEVLGYDEDELLNTPFLEFVHPDDRADAQGQLGEAISGKRIHGVRMRTRHKDGRYLTIEWRAQADLDAQVVHAIGTDVTAQVRSEKLAHLHGLVAAAANDLDDPREAVQITLHAVRDVTGWSLGHAYEVDPHTGRATPTGVWSANDVSRFEDFVHLTERTSFGPGEGLVGAAIASGEPEHLSDVSADETFVRRAAASTSSLRTALAFPVFIRHEVVAVLEFYSETIEKLDVELADTLDDVATQLGRAYERARRNEALRVGIAGLEQSNAELARFAHVASHDLKSPLTTVIGFLELATTKGVDSDHVRRAFEGAQRMNEVIDQLLADAESQSDTTGSGQIELDQIAIDVLADLGRTIEVSGARITLGNLPTVHGHAASLRVLLQNLVTNAIAHAPAGDQPVVVIDGEVDGDLGRLWVEDEGPGVAAANREAIFEPRTRGDSSGGAGLGLATCRRIALRHGGTIRVEDGGVGARFVVELPLERQSSSP